MVLAIDQDAIYNLARNLLLELMVFIMYETVSTP